MLAGAVILGPLTFSWSALAAFLILAGITLCAGHSVGFHRRLIHRSFECPIWLERAMIWIGTLVGMGGPLWTVRLHDTRTGDSAGRTVTWFLRHGKPILVDGFYYLNFRLILARPPGFDAGPGVGDVAFYRFLQRTWMLHQVPIAALLFWIGGWPLRRLGRPGQGIGLHRYRTGTYPTSAHTSGPRDWSVDGAVIQAYNVPWLAIPTMGESWHSNHHAFPASARHGLYPGQIDPGYYFVMLLERLGLAWDVKAARQFAAAAGYHADQPSRIGRRCERAGRIDQMSDAITWPIMMMSLISGTSAECEARTSCADRASHHAPPRGAFPGSCRNIAASEPRDTGPLRNSRAATRCPSR